MNFLIDDEVGIEEQSNRKHFVVSNSNFDENLLEKVFFNDFFTEDSKDNRVEAQNKNIQPDNRSEQVRSQPHFGGLSNKQLFIFGILLIFVGLWLNIFGPGKDEPS